MNTEIPHEAVERLDANRSGDPFAAALHRNIYDFVLARLTPGHRILEVGTGLGAFSRELTDRAAQFVGVEYDSDSCRSARLQAGPAAAVIRADAKRLPLREQQFSFAVCLEVLEHLGDYASAVRSIHRSLAPGAVLIVSVPYRKNGGPSRINPYHIYEPGEQELLTLFRALFEKVEPYYQYFEETTFMTLARKLHLRRVFGLDRIYGDLATGKPHALSQLKISQEPRGMKLGLMLVARNPLPCSQTR